MAFIYRREVLRGLAASGIVLSSVGRNVAALECNTADAKHVVIGKQTSDVSGFDPHLNSSASAAEIIGNLYETLITLKDGNAVPGLATWKSEGALWTFTIKPDQRFASGNLITAADAAFSLKRALKINNSPALPLVHLGLTFGNAEQCINVGKSGELLSERDTLIIALPTYVEESIVLHCLTSAGCSILDSGLIKSRWSPNPRVLDTSGCVTFGDSFYTPDVFVPYLCRFSARDDGEAWLRFNSAGSGPFQIRNAERTDEIVLQRNLRHPDYVKSNPLPLIVRDVADPREQQRLLQCREIQVAWDLHVEDPQTCARETQAKKQLTTKEKKASTEPVVAGPQPKANLLLLCMNTKKTPLDDGHIRKGIRQAIDNDALECSLKSPRWKAQYRFFPSAIEGYDEADVSTRTNFAEAETALAKQKCSLKLDYLGGAGRSAVANELAWQLGKRGVDLKLDPASTGRIFQERLEKREFDLALVSFSSDYLHPHSNAHAMCTNSDWEDINTFDGPHTLAWYCHWRDDTLVKMVAHAAGASKDEQSKDYKDIQTGLFDRGPYAFLLEESAYVTGVKHALPLLGPLNNQTRYSPTQQT